MITTFYSYKGGTGRTMAVANCACLIARDDVDPERPRATSSLAPRVLAIDWDLEAPGLHRYFQSLPAGRLTPTTLADLEAAPGVIEMFEEFRDAIDVWTRAREASVETDSLAVGDDAKSSSARTAPVRSAKNKKRKSTTATQSTVRLTREVLLELLGAIDFKKYTVPLGIGNLSLMKAGKYDDHYAARVNRFRWDDLFDRSPLVFSAFAEFVNSRYDHVLIDSRTGTTDTSDICTTLLPEKLAVVFTPNLQSLTGVSQLITRATAYRRSWGDQRPLSVFPVPSRLENAMPELLRRWREGASDDSRFPGYQKEFERLFDDVYGTSGCSLQDYFHNVGIQHVPDYAFGEPLAVEIEQGTRLSLRRSYQVLTQRLLLLRAPWESLPAVLAQREIGTLLAAMADPKGDASKAVSDALRALQLHQEHPDVEAPALGVALEGIAMLRFEQKPLLPVAEQLFEGAIAVAERAFGVEAVETASVLERYARALSRAVSSDDKTVSSDESNRLLRKAADYVRDGLKRKVTVLGDDADSLYDAYDLAADIFSRAGLNEESIGARGTARRIRPAVAPDGAFRPSTGPLRLFLSYAHEDERFALMLLKHLKPLERAGILAPWHDRRIVAGEQWGSLIDANLEQADVVLMLVSASFLASDYCYDVEMKRALERHSAGEARVIPIIVTPSAWSTAPFAHLQALPREGRAVALWENQDVAWTGIAEELKRLAQTAEDRSRSAGSQPKEDPTRYLAALRDQNSYLDIRGMGAQVTERMELAHVYTRLTVSAPHRETLSAKEGPRRASKATKEALGDESFRGESNRELRDVLAGAPHAALVGDPGSGKTTFLRFVAQNLARARLGDAEALGRIGLSGEAPFPVFIQLSRFARFLGDKPDVSVAEDSPAHMGRFLEFELTTQPHDLPPDYVKRRVARGNCLLLLDGLDEVPGDAMRQRMVQLIDRLIVDGKAVGNRHLITCRTRAYEGQMQLTGDVTTLRLASLDAEQVQRFAEAWSRALFRVEPGEAGTSRADQAVSYCGELLRAIAENPSGATFTQSPLMLTVLAVVHWNQKRLPEQRADLYDAAVTYLLESRREHAAHSTTLRREALQAVAITMFEDTEGVQRTLSRREAAAAVLPVLSVSLKEAEEFLENEELYSGLLVSRTEGEVEFWHLTFQEYLAALELSQAENGWARVAPNLYNDRWAEVVLLLAGCERRSGGTRAARRMIERILKPATDPVAKARAVGLVGRILRDIRAYGGDPEQGTTYTADLKATLSIFEPGGPDVEEAVRVEVGEALGQAGDPRLERPEANRVQIPGGTFWMGAQIANPNGRGYDADAFEAEAPVREVTVSPFIIGRYPVTVAEFGEFLDAGKAGYLREELWDSEGWAWRKEANRTGPGDWDDQRLHPNRPVTSVSWYEADAYCQWKGARLPTEAEWEWVARGAEGRKYPWGSDPAPTSRHANFEMHVGMPTPVGIYPADVHERGVRDLAGNVWEWCADLFGEYKGQPDTNPRGPASGTSRVLRGGSFYFGAPYLRAACRFSIHPELEDYYFGFRVVWSLAGGQT